MSDNSYKPTVQPKDESLYRQDNAHGGPGIHIPKDAANIQEFREVSNVDAKELNARIKAENALKAEAKEHGINASHTPGIHVPTNANDIEAFKQVGEQDAKEFNAQLHKN